MKYLILIIVLVFLGTIATFYLPQVLGTSTNVASQIYEVKALYGQTNSTPQDVNSKGTVIGYSYTSDNQPHAFIWQDEISVGIGSLGGATSTAHAINELGKVVGNSQKVNNTASKSFTYDKGKMTELPSLMENFAYDISETGKTVGTQKITSLSPTRATLWDSFQKSPKLIGTLGGDYSEAKAINRMGNITGSSSLEINSAHKRAFLWNYNSAVDNLKDLGVLLGGDFSSGEDINDSNIIVGYSETNSGFRAFKWTALTNMKSLGLLEGDTESKAFGINKANFTVGISSKITDPTLCTQNTKECHRAVLWKPDGTIVDLTNYLNDPAWHLLEATEISDNNYIVGRGLLNNTPTGFLLIYK